MIFTIIYVLSWFVLPACAIAALVAGLLRGVKGDAASWMRDNLALGVLVLPCLIAVAEVAPQTRPYPSRDSVMLTYSYVAAGIFAISVAAFLAGLGLRLGWHRLRGTK